MLLSAFVIGTLYLAQEILVPLALAGLITFLLAPLVSWIERWLGRVAAVLLVVLMLFGAFGAGGWILTRQMVDLAEKLPDYQVNIQTKLRAIKLPQNGAFKRISQTIDELKKDLPGAADPLAAKQKASAVLTDDAGKVPVQIVETSSSGPLAMVRMIAAPLLGPLGTAGLVLILVIFMLLQREDLRSRLIRLVGQGRISSTKRALDDAGQRVSRYLSMQLVVNIIYGATVACGLSFLSVPNAMLWGALATVLRFIPYLGPWIAATLPTALAFAVSSSWATPLYTVGLFLVLETIINNVLEPWLYGSSTGVSSIALIVGAMFWTFMWGPVGLLLATPLTVCLVVMGRHVPRLEFLSVLLSDEQALSPSEECYHRLLAVDPNEVTELVESHLKTGSLTSLYDSVLIPVITAEEMDFRQDALDEKQHTAIHQTIREIVDDLESRPPAEAKIETAATLSETAPPSPPAHIVCLPARAERDELAGVMLAQLLARAGFAVQTAAGKLATGDLLELVAAAPPDLVCISVVAPSTIIQARYLCTKLRARFPEVRVLVGLWGSLENLTDVTQRLRASGADEVVATLAQAVLQAATLTAPRAISKTPAASSTLLAIPSEPAR